MLYFIFDDPDLRRLTLVGNSNQSEVGWCNSPLAFGEICLS